MQLITLKSMAIQQSVELFSLPAALTPSYRIAKISRLTGMSNAYTIKKDAHRAPRRLLCILLPVFRNSAPRFCKAVIFFTAFRLAAVPTVDAKKGWITLPPWYINASVRDFYGLLIQHAESVKCFFCVFSGSHGILSFPL